MAIQKALVQADDLLRPPLSHKRCELINGVVVEMSPPGYEHSRVAARFLAKLLSYAEQHGGEALGQVGVWTSRDPDTVREPDAALTTASRLGRPSRGFLETAPDLVVEVISPNDSNPEVLSKVAMWLEAGVRLVWVAYPDAGTVVAYQAKNAPKTFSGGDVLDGKDTLPGFRALVKEFFA